MSSLKFCEGGNEINKFPTPHTLARWDNSIIECWRSFGIKYTGKFKIWHYSVKISVLHLASIQEPFACCLLSILAVSV